MNIKKIKSIIKRDEYIEFGAFGDERYWAWIINTGKIELTYNYDLFEQDILPIILLKLIKLKIIDSKYS